VLASCEVLRDEAGAVESWYALADGEIRELLEATLDADALAAARADGRTLSVDEAVQLAVGAAEAERPRP
jgi:hypothetical protein